MQYLTGSMIKQDANQESQRKNWIEVMKITRDNRGAGRIWCTLGTGNIIPRMPKERTG